MDFPWRADLVPGGAPIAVRLDPAEAFPPDAPVTPEPEQELRERFQEDWGQTRFSTSESAGQNIESDPTLLALDPRYYQAQDLDSYPRPLSPLRFGRPAGSGAEEVLLEILVDERGIVQDVILARPSQPGRLDEELRALLAATQFSPARKDGRAVRSRVTLSVRF